MSSYEDEQKRLADLWNDILSDEESDSSELFGDLYLSDAYSPRTSEADSSDSSFTSKFAQPKKKRLRADCSENKLRTQNDGASTSREENVTPNNQMNDDVDQVIEDVIAQFTVQNTASEDEEIEDEDNNIDMSQLNWRSVDGTSLKQFPFLVQNFGIDAQIYEVFYNKTPIDIFKLFLTDEILTHIVVETNRYAEQCLAKPNKPKSRVRKWIPTNNLEIEKFLGVLLWMGLVKQPSLRSYWRKNPLYSNEISKILPRNRFELLLAMVHFSDNEDASLDNDRLRKLSPLVTKLLERFQNIFTPGLQLCIDETMVPFRGRLRFKQYIKNKKKQIWHKSI